jgi:phosphoribosyl 1,2-cyclic phosphodiesterase
MKISVLASGSKGNVTYIEHNNVKILIDLGVSIKYIEEKLNDIDINPKDIDAILLTHMHDDHTKGIKSFWKKYKTKIYITSGMVNDFSKFICDYSIYESNNENIKGIDIKILKTSHDVNESIGFIIKADLNELVYITDTGYINYKNLEKIKNKDIYIFESNYDIDLLMNGKYPHYLKQRIHSDKGHLSNGDSSMYLSKVVGDRTKHIVLVHLSEENNDELIALETINRVFYESKTKINNIIIAKQNERTELIEI